jgi:two-component system, cell cycle sensor histidine kinase and response regulator CckA
MKSELRLLMIEDSDEDAELIRMELERAGYRIHWKRVQTEPDLVSALDEPWDLIISDFRMPGFDGLRAFAIYEQRGLDVPFIFVSGEIGEERAVEAMRAGARDYMLKDNLARLNVAVKRELRESENRRRRQVAEEATRREQYRLAMAVEASGAGVFEHRVPLERSLYVSELLASMIGCDTGSIPVDRGIVDWLRERIHPESLALLERAYEDFLEGRTERHHCEARVRHQDGRWLEVSTFAKAVERDERGRASHVVGVILDVSSLRHLEAKLLQAQKMEAIGRLAGGVAHDFNNLLTAILSFGSMVLSELDPTEAAREDMVEVLEAARRAEELTAQLLAFSRKKTISPRVVNVNTLVRDTERMLRRMLGEDIEFVTHLADDLWNVRIDPSAFEQVLMNMAVNARDAMATGGKLTIQTLNTLSPDGEPHAMVAISDNGVGMDEQTRSQIFEPFFTTKELGRGTGLGLSTCYGIVKQAGGFITVETEVSIGTTFRIHLPRDASAADPAKRKRREPSSLSGNELILVTEDDDQVRRLTVRALKRHGYRVLQAANANEAIQLCQTTTERIDLLLTDVVMPGLSGKELAERLLAIQPGLKLLFMSGYNDNMIQDRGFLGPAHQLLEKPFTPDVLALTVRQMLDG